MRNYIAAFALVPPRLPRDGRGAWVLCGAPRVVTSIHAVLLLCGEGVCFPREA